jgi:lysophospholipase L1-like esterase
MSISRTHVLIAALAGSLGLNAWVVYKALRGRDRGVLPDIVQQTRTEAREDLFTLVTIRKDAIVLLGDSHLEYFPHQDLLEGHRVVNRGISGETSADVHSRLPSVLAARPRAIVLLAGVNDLFMERSPDETMNDLTAIVDDCRSAGVELFVLSIPPNAMPAVQDGIDTMNKDLATLCRSRGVRFVDLDSALRKDGLIDPALTFDGLHLNAKGYLRMAATLRGVLPPATRPV